MKLAIVRQSYTPFGGAERFVERAVEALNRSDLSLTIVARRWRGAPTHEVLRCDPFHLGRTWRDASFARCVQKLIADRRFDIVQSHERITGCDVFRAGDGIHATWLELRSRAGGSLSRLGQALSPWHRYTLAAEAAMFADPRLRAVICNSRMVRDDLARRFGLDSAKLHVIYNGIDLDDYSPALRDAHRSRVRQEQGVGEAAPVMLFVGSGFERKGVRALIDAAAMMRESGAQLWIIGKDKHRARYEAHARGAGVAGRVRFLGPQQDVRPYYGAADAFALPTLYDPFPNAALEALASGLPLVTSASCGASELVEPGRNGFVCDALDIPALARSLDALCAPGAARAMAAAARATAMPLSREAMADRLVALYRSLMA
ncbi:MAG: glycosyltransferase family 4 protein [Sterolibacteriaceae bacterium]|uniref:Glycosyltransferase family 4 protein n=1 Tax=Candidatus Methylophosphatis roskildensis TaxID=2899263 RepID=A0A9D7E115_9PROT|nr:glycosyltransferase family 4 protein [Candidatus Methylophosphatis roskildensis]